MRRFRNGHRWCGRTFRLTLAWCSVIASCSPSGPRVDVAAFGEPDSILSWTPAQQLTGFRHFAEVFPTRAVAASDDPFPLPTRMRDLASLQYAVDGRTFDLDDFLAHNYVVGLLVIQRDTVVYEHYAQGNTPSTLWVSFSIAKSVVSLLIGAAVQDGYIASLDEPVTTYLPVLRGSAYEGVALHHVLNMASGVAWNEDYTDPDSDVSHEIGLTSLQRLRYLGRLPKVAPPGARFNYSTGETHLLGSVLRSAVGSNLSTYLASKIWQPFGMEAAANWMLVEPGGAEHGGCCLSAILRDYGRIGLFALHRGVLRDGTRVLPEDWMEASTAPSPSSEGYGYLWWLRGGGVYNALGIYGQAIWVDPAAEMVMVTHSVWPQPTGEKFSAHRNAFMAAVTLLMSAPRN